MAITRTLLFSAQVRLDDDCVVPKFFDRFPAVKVKGAGKAKYNGRVETGDVLQKACSNGGRVVKVYTQ